MCHNLDIVGIGDAFAARVHHCHKGHAPEVAAFAYTAKDAELVGFGLGTNVDMNGDCIRAHLQALFDLADLNFIVGIGTQRRRSAHMHNQADISAVAAMPMPDHSLLLKNGVGSAFGYFIHHLRQVYQSLDRTD